MGAIHPPSVFPPLQAFLPGRHSSGGKHCSDRPRALTPASTNRSCRNSEWSSKFSDHRLAAFQVECVCLSHSPTRRRPKENVINVALFVCGSLGWNWLSCVFQEFLEKEEEVWKLWLPFLFLPYGLIFVFVSITRGQEEEEVK